MTPTDIDGWLAVLFKFFAVSSLVVADLGLLIKLGDWLLDHKDKADQHNVRQ